MDFRKIVWISSYPKSGNTWLRLLLDAYYLGDVDINDIETSHGDLAGVFYALDNQPPNRYPVGIQYLIRPAALSKMIIHHMNSGKQVPLFLKSHVINAQLQSVHLYPIELTHSVIYLVRDPRDVAKSWASHMGYTYDEAITKMNDDYMTLINSNGEQVAGFLSSWRKHVSSFTHCGTHNVGLVRYEDMKKAPEEALAYVLRHIGQEPDMDKVKKAVKLCELSRLKAQEEKEGFMEKSDKNNGFFGQSHKELTIKQRRRVEKLFGREMKLLGYEVN